MPQVKNNFLGSKMNKDLDYRLIPEGEYITAQNIQITKSEGSDVGVVQNIKGNSLTYTTSLFDTTYKCIGSFFDEKEDRVFLFVTDNDQDHRILLFDTNQPTQAPATIVSGVFLNFDQDKLITGVNLVEDLLFWTDDLNEPRRININKAINDNSYYSNDYQISVAKIAPYKAPSIQMYRDENIDSKFIEDKFVRFSYRLKYEEDEYSVFAPFSQVAFQLHLDGSSTPNNKLTESQEEKAFEYTELKDFKNGANKVEITVTLPNYEVLTGVDNQAKIENYLSSNKHGVTHVDIIYKQSDSIQVKIVDTIALSDIPYTDITITDNGLDPQYIQYTYTYNSTIPKITISNDQVTRVYDNVPLLAKSQEVVGNRLVYGNYVENIDAPSKLDFTVSYEDVNSPSDYIHLSLKQKREYSVGIILSDRYGRTSPVILAIDGSSSVSVAFDTVNSFDIKSLTITFNSTVGISSQWESYSVVVKQSEQEYYNVYTSGLSSYRDSSFATIFSSNINKVPRTSDTINADTEISNSNQQLYVKLENQSYVTSPVENKTGTTINVVEFSVNYGGSSSWVFNVRLATDYEEYTSGGYNGQVFNVDAVSPLLGGGTANITSVEVFVDGIICSPGLHYNTTLSGSNIVSISFVNEYTQPLGREIRIYKVVQYQGSAGDSGTAIIKAINGGITGFYGGGSGATETGNNSILPVYIYTGDNETPLYSSSEYTINQVQEGTDLLSVIGIGTIDKFNEIPDYFIDTSNTLNGYGFYKVENNYLLASISGQYGITLGGDQLIAENKINQLAVLETKPFESSIDIYYETSTNDLISNIVDGEKIYIKYFNTVIVKNQDESWHIEESRIKGSFNGVSIDYGVQAFITDSDYKQKRRYNSLIYSGLYNPRTGTNNTNQFSIAEISSKSLDPQNGSIQKLFAEDDNLTVFQEEKTSWIAIDKDVLYTAEGEPQVIASSKVLGQVVPYAGNYGVGTHPESFAYYAGRKYFACANKGVILRLSRDGMTEISNYGMRSYFRNILKQNSRIYGSWDIHNKTYNLSIDSIGIGTNETLVFDEEAGGWVSFYTYVSEFSGSINGNYYTTKSGDIWLHYSNSTRNSFYGGSSNPSVISISINAEPSLNKNFLTLGYEGTSGWSVSGLNTDLNGVYYTDTAYPIAEYNISNQDLLISAFKKQNSSYVANIINETPAKANEVIYGETMSGVKGMYMVVDMSTSSTEYKELFTITSNFNINNY